MYLISIIITLYAVLFSPNLKLIVLRNEDHGHRRFVKFSGKTYVSTCLPCIDKKVTNIWREIVSTPKFYSAKTRKKMRVWPYKSEPRTWTIWLEPRVDWQVCASLSGRYETMTNHNELCIVWPWKWRPRPWTIWKPADCTISPVDGLAKNDVPLFNHSGVIAKRVEFRRFDL